MTSALFPRHHRNRRAPIPAKVTRADGRVGGRRHFVSLRSAGVNLAARDAKCRSTKIPENFSEGRRWVLR